MVRLIVHSQRSQSREESGNDVGNLKMELQLEGFVKEDELEVLATYVEEKAF